MLRKTVFWLHLVAGLLGGLVIAVLCFTGATLAFEKEIVAWAERDARHASPPSAETQPLPLDTLLSNAREARPDARPSGITASADRTAAVAVTFGRDDVVYVDPYSGEVREPASRTVHDFMHLMLSWHRWLGMNGEDSRPAGRAVTGATSIVFLVLALSGLFIWWPRHWSWRGFKAIAVLNLRLTGKARDFNWHNAFGLWCAPVLIVLTLTAMPISYRWAGNLVYRIAGTEPPQGGGRGAPQAPPVAVPAPPAGAQPASYETLLASVRTAYPNFADVTFRLGGGRGAGNGQGAGQREGTGAGRGSAAGERQGGQGRGGPGGTARGPQTVTATVRTGDQWPLFSSNTVSLDPYTAGVLRTDTFAAQDAGRRLRSWLRFLHTGEALGWPGKLAAALASLGGLFLVWTGFALSWRRFFRRRTKPAHAPQM